MKKTYVTPSFEQLLITSDNDIMLGSSERGEEFTCFWNVVDMNDGM